jgi:hypothetical protein
MSSLWLRSAVKVSLTKKRNYVNLGTNCFGADQVHRLFAVSVDLVLRFALGLPYSSLLTNK